MVCASIGEGSPEGKLHGIHYKTNKISEFKFYNNKKTIYTNIKIFNVENVDLLDIFV